MKVQEGKIRRIVREVLKEVSAIREIAVNGAKLDIEIADTPEKRLKGLMNRKKLDPNSGMMFVFQDSDEHSFWMKDTHIPLSIAYIDDKGTILNIEDMKPHSLDSVKPNGPCRYALEVNKGWFDKNGIRAGDEIIMK